MDEINILVQEKSLSLCCGYGTKRVYDISLQSCAAYRPDLNVFKAGGGAEPLNTRGVGGAAG